jgi:hypothetical protein
MRIGPDEFAGHPPELKNIHDFNMRETTKELDQMDSAFVISYGGVILSAATLKSFQESGCSV